MTDQTSSSPINAPEASRLTDKNLQMFFIQRVNREYQECQKRIKNEVLFGNKTTTCQRETVSDKIHTGIWPLNKTIYDNTLLPETIKKLSDDKFQVSSEILTKRVYFDDDDYNGWMETQKVNRISW